MPVSDARTLAGEARYAEFARKGGHLWDAPASDAQSRNESRAMRNILFNSAGCEEWELDPCHTLASTHVIRPEGEDAAREELFGSRRPAIPQDVRAGRSVTDVMPFVDTDSPLSLLDANRAMAERAAELTDKAGPKNDGTFAGLLRSPRPSDATRVSNTDIVPYNDGTALGDARAVAQSIASGRHSTTQTRMVPGRSEAQSNIRPGLASPCLVALPEGLGRSRRQGRLRLVASRRRGWASLRSVSPKATVAAPPGFS